VFAALPIAPTDPDHCRLRESRAPATGVTKLPASALLDGLRRLRPEEFLFLVGFIPSSLITIWANYRTAQAGIASPQFESALLRLGLASLLACTMPVAEHLRIRLARRPRSANALEFYRTMLPFVLCIAVYTNLHDTVRFVNPHDVHDRLVAIEEWLFGGQPVVWAERYITRGRTEVMSAFYQTFFMIAPSTVIVLWASGKRREAREVLLGVIVCFYTGYLLYLVFPAAPPRLYMESLGMFKVNLRGGPILNVQDSLLRMMPHDASRAAFPSLHAAVSLLALYYSWRYCRWYCPILLVAVTGLLVSTIYLRHHYVVDLVAGAMLVPWVLWAAPRFDRWWRGLVGAGESIDSPERA
jgi:membrane-associated phospholipid phosphatase